jgi:hypothetical protein
MKIPLPVFLRPRKSLARVVEVRNDARAGDGADIHQGMAIFECDLSGATYRVSSLMREPNLDCRCRVRRLCDFAHGLSTRYRVTNRPPAMTSSGTTCRW